MWLLAPTAQRCTCGASPRPGLPGRGAEAATYLHASLKGMSGWLFGGGAMPCVEQKDVIILTSTGGKAGAQSHEPQAGSSRSPLGPRWTWTKPGEGGTW